MVSAYAVSVVAGEDNDGIFLQIVFVDGIDNLTDFTVYFLYQAVVRIAVHTPVFGSKGSGGVHVEVVGSFVFDDIGIVRILGEVGRKSRTVTQFRCVCIAVRQVLAARIFADVVRVIVRSYQKEGLVVLLGQEFHASFGQSVVAVLVYLVETVLLVGNIEFGHMPFAAVCTLVSGIFDERSAVRYSKRSGT